MRRLVVGPSSGITTAGADARDVEDLRGTGEGADDLRERREVVEERVEAFPGIFEHK